MHCCHTPKIHLYKLTLRNWYIRFHKGNTSRSKSQGSFKNIINYIFQISIASYLSHICILWNEFGWAENLFLELLSKTNSIIFSFMYIIDFTAFEIVNVVWNNRTVTPFIHPLCALITYQSYLQTLDDIYFFLSENTPVKVLIFLCFRLMP